MGALGRACLYASFALAVSVTGVMAASDAAIPGDVLYPLKRGIEEMRLDVLPDEFHDELAVYALSERIDELSQLVEAGDVARASTLAGSIHDAYEQAVAESDDADGLARRLDRQVARLAQVVSGLPSQARASIAHAMAGAPGLMLDAWTSDGSEPGAEPASSSGGSGQGPGSGRGQGSDQGRGAGCARRRSVTGRHAEARRHAEAGPHAEAGADAERRCEQHAEADPEGPGEGAHTRLPEARRRIGSDGISRRDGGEPPSRLCQGAG